ncbi:GntR family transcriptional regulator [Pandoraea sp. XY-2]|uniref:GntR family transcriptional regulator n=1 Tax=Pandoraea sp. XY-2 TaxID=2518599 RepID=UPI00101B1FD9|nr:GntR family transcriptional regulator [Pandoraea sp. XY-2]QBC32351.1 GntR family transcriptional regulator [Pandoraea sp. XY-2]
MSSESSVSGVSGASGLSGTSGRRRLTAYQYAIETLRTEILQGKLKAGDRLRQDDLARRLEMSTTPVREALRTLVSEGLVFFDVHRGAVVRGLTIDDVNELYRLRKTLEPMMAEQAMATLREADIANAQALHAEMRETSDVAKWTELNQAFHAALWASQDNSRLAHLIKTLRDASGPYIALSLHMRPVHIGVSNREHQKMLAEYRARDIAAARQHTADHLDATLRIIVKAIEQTEAEAAANE